jgi:hypothetical protein
MGLNGDHFPGNRILGELLRLVPKGLGFFGTVNAIETDFDLFVGIVQNCDGIAISNMNDLGVEVGGVSTA